MDSNDSWFWFFLFLITILMCWVVIKEIYLSKLAQNVKKDKSNEGQKYIQNNHNKKEDKEKTILITKLVKLLVEIEENKKDIIKNQENLIINKQPQPQKEIQPVNTKEMNKKIFLKNKKFLKKNDSNHSDYVKILFETGMLYENLYKDWFRAACYVYLATLLEPSNKKYEKKYISLCNKVREKNGVDWEYYITMIHDISDIERYIDKLLNKNKKKEFLSKSKTVVKKPTPQSIYIKPVQQNTSKFEEFNTESYLHSLGYKVGATGLTEYQRRRLLNKVLAEGKISKYDVIETLEKNISMFSHRNNRQKAVADWKNDLRYIKDNF